MQPTVHYCALLWAVTRAGGGGDRRPVLTSSACARGGAATWLGLAEVSSRLLQLALASRCVSSAMLLVQVPPFWHGEAATRHCLPNRRLCTVREIFVASSDGRRGTVRREYLVYVEFNFGTVDFLLLFTASPALFFWQKHTPD